MCIVCEKNLYNDFKITTCIVREYSVKVLKVLKFFTLNVYAPPPPPPPPKKKKKKKRKEKKKQMKIVDFAKSVAAAEAVSSISELLRLLSSFWVLNSLTN